MKKFLSVFIFLLFYFSAPAQNYFYKQFTYSNGLPTMTLYQLYCSPDGFNWAGSDIGLLKYDGREFKLLTTEDGLPDTEILRVFGDTENRIWGLTFSNKIFYVKDNIVYNSSNSKLINTLDKKYFITDFAIYPSGELFLFSSFDCVSIKGDSINEIKIKSNNLCSAYQNIYKYKNNIYASTSCKDSTAFEWILVNDTFNITGIPAEAILHDFPKKNGNYYVSTDGIKSDINSTIIIPEKSYQDKNLSPKAFVDNHEGIWLYNNLKGVKLYNGDKRDMLFPDFKITDIAQDFEGNYWFATVSNGLIMLPHDYIQKKLLSGSATNEPYPVKSVFIDEKDRIWEGNTFAGIKVYDPPFALKEGTFADKTYYSRTLQFESIGDNMFSASDQGFFEIKETENALLLTRILKERKSCKSIAALNENEVFVCFSFGITKLTRRNNVWVDSTIYNKRAFSVGLDKNKNLWFGGFDGIYQYKSQSVNLIPFKEIEGYRILDFAFYDKQNIVILSTDGYGLFAFDQNTYQLKWRANIKTGLTSDLCRHIQLINDTAYVNTVKGLNRLKITADSFITLEPFTISTGLPNDDIQDFYIKNTTLALAGNFGVMVWNNFLSAIDLPSPKLHLTEIITEKGISIPVDKIVSEYKTGFVKIYYSAIRYAAAAPELEFSVDGETWQATGASFVEFRGLTPGKHVIQFRLKNILSEPSTTASIELNIEAPFYYQNWFVPIMISFLALLIAGTIIYRNNRIKEKTIERSKVSEALAFAEQQALQSMMNPHFIFNAVNSVQQYIIKNDKREANKYLTQFARLIRLNLETSKNKHISLEEEIERLSLYLQFEKVRFGEKLEYNITSAAELETDKILIPSMIIQPFVENAIWHGIMPKMENGFVNIAIEKQVNNLLIHITDNGIGYNSDVERPISTDKTSLGTSITKKRLALLTEQTGNLHKYVTISPKFDGEPYPGTEVIITIPILYPSS